MARTNPATAHVTTLSKQLEAAQQMIHAQSATLEHMIGNPFCSMCGKPLEDITFAAGTPSDDLAALIHDIQEHGGHVWSVKGGTNGNVVRCHR